MAKKAAPKVSVLERRLQDPLGAPSVDIHLTDGKKWALRILNANVRSGRIYTAIHHLGWEFVKPSELDGTPEELGFREMDGRVVRGERGEEVLVKMPLDAYNKIQMAKAEKNIQGLGKKQTLEQAAQMAATNGMGDQAAETIYNSNMQISDARGGIDLEGDNPS